MCTSGRGAMVGWWADAACCFFTYRKHEKKSKKNRTPTHWTGYSEIETQRIRVEFRSKGKQEQLGEMLGFVPMTCCFSWLQTRLLSAVERNAFLFSQAHCVLISKERARGNSFRLRTLTFAC